MRENCPKVFGPEKTPYLDPFHALKDNNSNITLLVEINLQKV